MEGHSKVANSQISSRGFFTKRLLLFTKNKLNIVPLAWLHSQWSLRWSPVRQRPHRREKLYGVLSQSSGWRAGCRGQLMSVPSYQRKMIFNIHNGEVFKEATKAFLEEKSQYWDISQHTEHWNQITTGSARGILLTIFHLMPTLKEQKQQLAVGQRREKNRKGKPCFLEQLGTKEEEIFLMRCEMKVLTWITLNILTLETKTILIPQWLSSIDQHNFSQLHPVKFT